jgi:hypothetical protein
MSSLKQNQKKPFIDDETLRRMKFQVLFNSLGSNILSDALSRSPNKESSGHEFIGSYPKED